MLFIGGNRQLKGYFARYGLANVSPVLKYTTKAAAHYRFSIEEHYRLKLQTKGDTSYLYTKAPSYNDGRE